MKYLKRTAEEIKRGTAGMTRRQKLRYIWDYYWLPIVGFTAGLLFLILTARGVGGFGKVGYCFSHTQGKRWMTPAEAKGNTYLFGFILLIIGLLCGLLTLRILGIF